MRLDVSSGPLSLDAVVPRDAGSGWVMSVEVDGWGGRRRVEREELFDCVLASQAVSHLRVLHTVSVSLSLEMRKGPAD